MPRIRVEEPKQFDLLDGYVGTEIVLHFDERPKFAIAKGDFAIYRDATPYGSDRGNYRIVHLPSRMEVAYGGIRKIEKAARYVDLHSEHAEFYSAYFDRVLKREATDEEIDRFIEIGREIRLCIENRAA